MPLRRKAAPKPRTRRPWRGFEGKELEIRHDGEGLGRRAEAVDEVRHDGAEVFAGARDVVDRAMESGPAAGKGIGGGGFVFNEHPAGGVAMQEVSGVWRARRLT